MASRWLKRWARCSERISRPCLRDMVLFNRIFLSMMLLAMVLWVMGGCCNGLSAKQIPSDWLLGV